MSYRLDRGPVARRLRRLVRKELDAAIGGLDAQKSSATGIHKARKHIKKARAIVTLLQEPLGKSYARENERLRAAARRLSELRDADAMLQTLASLARRLPAVITPAVQKQVANGLRRHQRVVHKQARAMAKQTLGFLRASRAQLPGRVGHVGRFREVRRGLARVYARSMSALADLTPASGADQFHAWRRRVKAHWYQVRLFELRQPARARARKLKALQSALGEDHNLAVLGETLLERPAQFGGAPTTALVLGCIQKRQQTLRRRAVASGRELFAVKPKHIAAMADRWRP